MLLWRSLNLKKMSIENILFKSKQLKIHKGSISPGFNNKTVIVQDHWDYVEMWLKKEKIVTALEYWNQAERFFRTCNQKDSFSAPLLLYYCFLNATKALLVVKKVPFKDNHGASGALMPGDTNLKNERIKFLGSGILTSLCNYFEEPCSGESYSMKDLLYNLPFVHRSFNLTFPSGYPEIYIPVTDVIFRKIKGNNEAWVSAKICNISNKSISNLSRKLENIGYEIYEQIDISTVRIRKKKRFRWIKRGKDAVNNNDTLSEYHKKVRKDFHYIHGSSTLWYLKNSKSQFSVQREPATIIFAVMHRLSELSRYEPKVISRHLELKQNWLITEFIQGATNEFIDRIASEITGQTIMAPAVRG